jgi:hypothetical protein
MRSEQELRSSVGGSDLLTNRAGDQIRTGDPHLGKISNEIL